MSQAREKSGQEISPSRKRYRDWRMWAIVLLMLGCMAIFMFMSDEAVAPVPVPTTNAPVQP